jgi:hypothetical protein
LRGCRKRRDCRSRLPDWRTCELELRAFGSTRLRLSRRRIGQEGFASINDGFLSVAQLGLVILEDDIEVGANTTIDRGSSRDTVIGAPVSITSRRSATMASSAGVVSSSHRSAFRVQPCLRISSASGSRRQWPGIFGSVKVRRSERRRASFRIWLRALKCLEALLSQKRTSSDKLPRSRRWQGTLTKPD